MNPPAQAADARHDGFEALRPRLFGIAYRMLGLRADAEDVVQDAWLRWRDTDPASLQSAEAWLVTVVTRLAIDRLRAAKLEREHYVGEWLAEPLVALDEHSPERIAERADELSLALLHVLERLGPEERAAYLLRQAFDYEYAEIAAILGKTEPAIRQSVHRATERVRLERPRFEVSRDMHVQLLQRFVAAASSGDRAAIRALVADNVATIGDGGGKVPSVRGGMHGGERVTNLFWAHYLRLGPRIAWRIADINGAPGLLRFIDGQLESAQQVETDGERIVAIYSVRNPDKLARIAAAP
ncbi:RNA polymerase sigma-70 factor [Ramlibacter ginsenosidimutans]|uniref:RNA polymerase sigma-70 factor n=1 Tax=Ramlibacter ginsenosidimutans TaxID=502333 RepID=A0A934TSU2_9BURK|nr:RNA polymerase sigma-70 factor [Ramlibacter ginsenosidimutans]MBK6006295.1 RNA polymerase sigma-70 factor [Ramlibacter ginsenosidimutans]